MEKEEYFANTLKKLRGKTIAVVYIFEGEKAPGFKHYWIWKSDIISGWLNAIQELDCMPFILDVRTFVQKAINQTLPHIDFVLNLNCGSCELSSMSLVPSMCSFLSIPCIPCNSCSIVASENKRIANLIASAMDIPIPASLGEPSEKGIYRPLNLGNSMGVEIGLCNNKDRSKGTYQEFIPGYDVTIPIVYNPYINDIDLLPAIVYLPHSQNPMWIYDELEKEKDNGFQILLLPDTESECKTKLLNFAKEFPIETFGRIDARIKSNKKILSENITELPLNLEQLYFIEINSMPTIEIGDSFEYAFDYVKNNEKHSFYSCIHAYTTQIKEPSIHGFLLACSMVSLLRAMY